MVIPFRKFLAVVIGLLAASQIVQAATLVEGDIRIGKVQGTVTVVQETPQEAMTLSEADKALGRSRPEVGVGKRIPAKEGYMLRQGEAIETGPNSRAVLLFSNGTAITVEPDSYFSVTKYLQDPFDPASYNFAEAKIEPTSSITELNLKKGAILGDVRKLNKGSSMSVMTPVGTAAIRGTQFKITVTSLGAGGGFSASLSVSEGSVSFTDGDGNPVTVGAGESTTISGNLEGGVSIADPTSLTPAEAEALIAAFNAMLASVDFSSTEPTTTSSGTLALDTGEGTTNVGTLDGGGGGTGATGGGGGAGGGGGGGGGAPTPTPVPTPPGPYGN
jgi:hypothetical protein